MDIALELGNGERQVRVIRCLTEKSLDRLEETVGRNTVIKGCSGEGLKRHKKSYRECSVILKNTYIIVNRM